MPADEVEFNIELNDYSEVSGMISTNSLTYKSCDPIKKLRKAGS